MRTRRRRPPLPMFLGLAVLTIAAHLLVALAHAAAHLALGIVLSPWNVAYVAAFVFAAPVAAGALLMRNATASGALLLSSSMALAGGFGLLHHYRWAGPDNALTVALGGWGDVFAYSAYMMLTFEILGFAVGGMLVAKPEKRATPTP
jgi:hypothetical protein